MDKQKQLTSKAYDRWSRIWNLARYTNGNIYDTALMLLDERHRRVMDVGCGTGLMSEMVAATGRSVCGVDISNGMIERARRRCRPGLVFTQGDAECLPSEDGSFDALVNLISFHHYPNPLRAVAEFRRVLRPGGRLILVAFNSSSRYISLTQNTNRWTKSIVGNSWQKTSGEVVALLHGAGFAHVDVTPVRYWISTFAAVAE